MKVLFLTNIPSPYRVDFFNELGKLCDLTVIFESDSSSERDRSWKNYTASHFKAIVLKGINLGVDHAFCPAVVQHIKKGMYDRVVISNFASPTGMLAILWLRLRKIPYWLESDGGFAKSGSGFKEKLKKYFIKGAAGYFSTAREHDRYYVQYGAEPRQLHRYPFTSLYARDVLTEPVTAQQKAVLRQKLGMEEQKILLAVGQFIPRKGFDVLINAMVKLPKDMGCYIVGGEPTEEYLQRVSDYGLKNVHFCGFKTKEVLARYFMAADVFVHPTREDIWGLVVNEAMAKSLPVITTDKCIAGLELVENGENGYIVPVGDDAALADRLNKLYAQPQQLEQMAKKSLQKIAPYTFEEMAKQHIAVLES